MRRKELSAVACLRDGTVNSFGEELVSSAGLIGLKPDTVRQCNGAGFSLESVGFA